MTEENNERQQDGGAETQPVPTFDHEEFARFAATIWKNRDEDTRIWLAAMPSKANKARAEELTKQKKPLPIECRTNQRAFGVDDAASLVKMANAEAGRRNLYVKVARFKRDASSPTLGNVQDIHCAWLDIDDLPDGPLQERVIQELLACPFPPHVLVSSGGGLHGYWNYSNKLNGKGLDKARAINENLARAFLGDLSVTHPAGGLRAPGSFNINRNKNCRIVHLSTADGYGPDKFAEWIDTQGPWFVRSESGLTITTPTQRSMLRAHEREAEKSRTATTDWDDVARALSQEGSENPFGGRNRALAKWAGKVYNMGGSIEDAIATAVKEGCDLPELEMRTVCESVARTHERLNGKAVPRTQADKVQEAPERGEDDDTSEPGDDAVDHGGAASPSANSPSSEEGVVTAAPSDAFNPKSAIARLRKLIELGQDEDEDFKFTVAGQLSTIEEAFDEWFDNLGGMLIYEGADTPDAGWWWVYKADTGVWHEKTTTQVESYVTTFWEHVTRGTLPKLADRREIVGLLRVRKHRRVGETPWDSGAPGRHLVVASNGIVIDIITGQEVPKDPSFYLTERSLLQVEYDPTATCPVWDKAIRATFEIDPEADKVALMVEEWMGSAILNPVRPRNTYRALVLQGESLGGKTTIGRALRAVIGDDHVASTGLDQVGGQFGLSSFFEKRASVWICDDPPVNSRLPEDLVKKLVTNESVTVNIKNKSMRDARLGLTVGIFGNEFPFVADASNAIYNRSIFMQAPMIFTDTPDPADPRQRKADPDLEDKLRAEGSGILNRMVAGARRLIQRGGFDLPASARDTGEAVHNQSAPSRDFLKSCFVPMPGAGNCVRKVHVRHALYGFMQEQSDGWYKRQRNVDAELRRLFKSMSTLYPRSRVTRNSRIKGTPTAQDIVTHLNFNEAGLRYLAIGRGLALEKPDQNFENDPEVKHANDLRYLDMDAAGKPVLTTIPGGKAHAQEAGE